MDIARLAGVLGDFGTATGSQIPYVDRLDFSLVAADLHVLALPLRSPTAFHLVLVQRKNSSSPEPSLGRARLRIPACARLPFQASHDAMSSLTDALDLAPSTSSQALKALEEEEPVAAPLESAAPGRRIAGAVHVAEM